MSLPQPADALKANYTKLHNNLKAHKFLYILYNIYTSLPLHLYILPLHTHGLGETDGTIHKKGICV